MDFALNDDQTSIRDLARQILADLVTDDALKALDRAGQWHHDAAWKALAGAGLLGVGVAEDRGGMGFGALEMALVGREIGRAVAPLPWLSAACGAAWALSVSDGTATLLRDLLAGNTIVAVALEEEGGQPLDAPTATARDGRLFGAKTAVLCGVQASHAVVSAASGAAASLYLVDLRGAGVRVEAQRATDGAPLARVAFDGAAAQPLAASAADLLRRMRVGRAAELLGVCERAVELTAAYTQTRQQFGMPIGMFQAVKQRIADAYIDTAALEVATLRAAAALDIGGDVDRAVLVASIWGANAGHRVTIAAQHLHGGMGFDRDYIIHRYFLRAKRLEFTLGSAPVATAELGALIAARGAA